MLLKVQDRIRECLHLAGDAGKRAAQATDPRIKADFIDIEGRYMHLAESYRFVEQVERFLDDAKMERKKR